MLAEGLDLPSICVVATIAGTASGKTGRNIGGVDQRAASRNAATRQSRRVAVSSLPAAPGIVLDLADGREQLAAGKSHTAGRADGVELRTEHGPDDCRNIHFGMSPCRPGWKTSANACIFMVSANPIHAPPVPEVWGRRLRFRRCDARPIRTYADAAGTTATAPNPGNRTTCTTELFRTRRMVGRRRGLPW